MISFLKKHNFITYLCLLVLCILFLLSCASAPISIDVPALQEVSIRRIEEQLANNEIPQVFQDIYTIKRTQKHPELEIFDILKQKAISLLLEKFDQAIENKDYLSAIRLYRTANQAGVLPEVTTQWNARKITKAQVFHEIEHGNRVAGLLKTRTDFPWDIVTDDELKLLTEIAYEETERGLLVLLINIREERGLKVPEHFYEDLDFKISHSELLDGTVTVMVDRGIKIRQGVGVPDRVIGSGFYIDRRGYILTNYHVIESEVDPKYQGYSRLYIRETENSRERIPAKVVGWNTIFDIALLKVEKTPDTVLSLETGKPYNPGDRIYAIGSPGGLEKSITSGIISATGRKFLQMGSVLQVDVPINVGNSGGPLLDDEGYLIGVVFAGIQQFEGVNFAIPASWILPLIPALYQEGAMELPFMGIDMYEDSSGLTVRYIVPGSPADRAGIQTGDKLISIKDEPINTYEAAHRLLISLHPDTLVKTKWKRNASEFEQPIALGKRPEVPIKEAAKRDVRENLITPLFGLKIRETSRRFFQTDYIVEYVYPGSPADELGLSENDPFSISRWEINEDKNVALMQIRVKKRKAGFLESGVQLAVYLDTYSFI